MFMVYSFRCAFAFVVAFLIQINVFSGVSSPAHIARMNKYDVTFYWLDLTVQKASNGISGSALTRARCLVNQQGAL